eukprot:Hpha_TRINITY_DN16889_c1_g2::TRINITY_DN16889_c1_g2_i1::g.148261::m.148261
MVGEGGCGGCGPTAVVVRQQFERWFQAMANGTVYEWAEDVMDPDVDFTFMPMWGTKHFTRGPREFCEHYNRLVTIVWGGPSAHVTWRINKIEATGDRSALASFYVTFADSPMFPGWMRLYGNARTLDFHVNLDTQTQRMKSCAVCIGMPEFKSSPTLSPGDHRDFVAVTIQVLCVASALRGLIGIDDWMNALLSPNAIVSVAGAQPMQGRAAFLAGCETLFDQLGWSAHEPAPLQTVGSCRNLPCGAVAVTVRAVSGQTLLYNVKVHGTHITSLTVAAEALPNRPSDLPPSLLSGLELAGKVMPPRAADMFHLMPIHAAPLHQQRLLATQVLPELRSGSVAGVGKLATYLQQLGSPVVRVISEQGEAVDAHDFREAAEVLQRSGALSSGGIWEGWHTGQFYERCCIVEPGPEGGRRYHSVDFVFEVGEVGDMKLVRIEASSGSASTDAVSQGAGRQLLRGLHAAMESRSFEEFVAAVLASDAVLCMEDYITRPGDVIGGTTLDLRELQSRYCLAGHPIVNAMRTDVQELAFTTEGRTARTRSHFDIVTRMRMKGKSLPTPFPRQPEVHQVDFTFRKQRVQNIHITINYDPVGPRFQVPPAVQRVGMGILNAALLPPTVAAAAAENMVHYTSDVSLSVIHASEDGKLQHSSTTVRGAQNLVACGAGASSVGAALRATRASQLAWRLEEVSHLPGGRGVDQRAVFSAAASPLQHPWLRWSQRPPSAPPIHMVVFDVRTSLAGTVENLSVFVSLPSGDWKDPMQCASTLPPHFSPHSSPPHSSPPPTWSPPVVTRSPVQLPEGGVIAPAPAAVSGEGGGVTAERQQSGSPQTNTAPCSHNMWDSVRIKRGYVILRCRQCSTQWRVEVSQLATTRCQSFDAGTCDESSCEELHIFRRKLKEGERGAANEEEREI